MIGTCYEHSPAEGPPVMTLGNAVMKMLVIFLRYNCLICFVVVVVVVVLSPIDHGSCSVAETFPSFAHNILFLYHGFLSQTLTVKRQLRKSKSDFILLYHLFLSSNVYCLAIRLLKKVCLRMQLLMRHKSYQRCYTFLD